MRFSLLSPGHLRYLNLRHEYLNANDESNDKWRRRNLRVWLSLLRHPLPRPGKSRPLSPWERPRRYRARLYNLGHWYRRTSLTQGKRAPLVVLQEPCKHRLLWRSLRLAPLDNRPIAKVSVPSLHLPVSPLRRVFSLPF